MFGGIVHLGPVRTYCFETHDHDHTQPTNFQFPSSKTTTTMARLWSAELLDDPLQHTDDALLLEKTFIVHGSCELSEWCPFWSKIPKERAARVALADYLARRLLLLPTVSNGSLPMEKKWQSLTKDLQMLQRSFQQQPTPTEEATLTPYMFERTDVSATTPDGKLHVYVRLYLYRKESEDPGASGDSTAALQQWMGHELDMALSLSNDDQIQECMQHVAVAVFQERLRALLVGKAVAFVADGSILPRESGASTDPMSSPPAIPFAAPIDSPLGQTISVDMGELREFLEEILPQPSAVPNNNNSSNGGMVTLRGLLVPLGVSLIVGGGYHGKSTLLRCIAIGVYNKIPGDGREFCATIPDALSIRAEDGRYVSQCNISAFLSNLPIPSADTTRFSSLEASGSTSQAANVVDAIEMGAKAFLVDEDVSAANFMARDGRMRALVMDESITPLLYRVNGIFHSLGISTVVVVGGVGDWLDVPDSVVLLNKYVCKDATAKARSISKQFSHGHVQYAGRGVVHRLEWDKKTTPNPRRPTTLDDGYDLARTVVSLPSGSNSIALYQQHGCSSAEIPPPAIDMSRIEQLLGKTGQLLGCGLGVVWVLSSAKRNTDRSLRELLEDFDGEMDRSGFTSLIQQAGDPGDYGPLLEQVRGSALRPRRFEVGQAILRLRTVTMVELPVEDDGSEAAAQAEAERRKRELLEIWNNRRKK